LKNAHGLRNFNSWNLNRKLEIKIKNLATYSRFGETKNIKKPCEQIFGEISKLFVNRTAQLRTDVPKICTPFRKRKRKRKRKARDWNQKFCCVELVHVIKIRITKGT
jgi:hypothetical protein